MKSDLGIIATMALLVPVVLFLIWQGPDESPESPPLEKHSRELVQIHERSKDHQLTGDMQKFEDSKKSMEEKLKEASLVHMGLEISTVDLIDGHYPFRDDCSRLPSVLHGAQGKHGGKIYHEQGHAA